HVHVIDSAIDRLHVRSESDNRIYDFADTVDGHGVLRAQDRVGKTPRGVQFKWQISARAQAGVDFKSNREWERGFLGKNGNLLRIAVFEDLEIVFEQVSNRRTARIRHRDEDI